MHCLVASLLCKSVDNSIVVSVKGLCGLKI